MLRILDASAFYAGVPFGSSSECHTTSQVYDEISHIKKKHGALDVLLDTGRLHIMEPNMESIKRAIMAAKATGDLLHLSKQDISILALAVETGGEIVTDDYAISNVAKNIGLTVSPVMTGSIKDTGRWIHYCPACGTTHTKVTECPACGTILRKKLLKSHHQE